MRLLPRLSWPTLGLLAILLFVVPAAPAAAPQTQDDRQKQIEQLEKQMLEIQKQLEALKKTPPAATTKPSVPEGTLPESVLSQYNWRSIGPANMGGRVTALAVVESDPTTYYVATASGGLLKTINNGTTFEYLFDKQSTVSIGDVAVASSNPDIVWVGTGEANPRNSVSYGDGVYKSTDGGKTFTNMGLNKTFQIGKICIHPKNPDVVYVGALGRLYGPNPDRGVFKTEDGGKTWSKVLYVDDKTGVIDMRLDPQDPNTIIAALWERKRDEFDGFFGEAPVPDSYGPIVTHGAGGGLFKSTDAGKTWKKLNDEKLKNGLPTVKTGRIGLDYSGKTKGLLVAIIDTEKVGTGTTSRVYMGIIGETVDGVAKISEITEGGPSDKAGLKSGDIVVKADETKITTYEQFVEYFQGKQPGDKIKVTVKRADRELVLEVTIGTRGGEAPAANPAPQGKGTRRPTGTGTAATTTPVTPIAGVVFDATSLKVQSVAADGPAAKAGIKADDVVTFLDGKKVTDRKEYLTIMQGKKVGDKVTITVSRGKEDKTFELILVAPAAAKEVQGQPQAPVPGSPPSRLMPGGLVPVVSFEGEVKIDNVTKGGEAEKAGLKAGDVITAVNGKAVANFREFLTELRISPQVDNARIAGDKLKLTIKQGDKSKEVELPLVLTPIPGMPAGQTNRGATTSRPYGLGLGGQSPNIQARQGKDGYQTGGIFISKDNGDNWTRVNSLNARPMYFSVVRFDPSDDNVLYSLCDVPSPIYRSIDGGKTFSNLSTAQGVHADAHSLWINSKNSRHLIIGCDGGFYVTYDKGVKWDHLNNFALGQFYHVAVDNKRPYRVYGGLQDNGSWGGPSNTLRRYGQVNEDWVYVSGGDGFVCRVDPNDPDLVYAESQGGAMNRRNFRTGEQSFIRPTRRQGDEALRFNWNTPFILSNHNSSIFYCGAQYIFRSLNKGDNLKQISPDLTRTKGGSMTAISESPRSPEVLWAGTDDGHVWVTKDSGLTWTNVIGNIQKAGLSGFRHVASIEASREKEGRCYVVLDAHRSDDDKPYVFVTDDFGATWKSLTSNLPAFGSTRVLREDITNLNILYLGTEFGAWVSANRGESWTKLGGGLPTVPVHEFAQPTVANELVIATHGRSVWVLDIGSIRQMKPEVLKNKVTLFAPSNAVRWRIGAGGESPYSNTDRKFVGQNPARGASLEYLLTAKAEKVSLKIVDGTGKSVRTFNTVPGEAGLNRVSWDLSTGSGTPTGGGGGRRAVTGGAAAGLYRVVLTVNGEEFSQPLTVELDPNASKDVINISEFDDEEEKDKTRRIDD